MANLRKELEELKAKHSVALEELESFVERIVAEHPEVFPRYKRLEGERTILHSFGPVDAAPLVLTKSTTRPNLMRTMAKLAFQSLSDALAIVEGKK